MEAAWEIKNKIYAQLDVLELILSLPSNVEKRQGFVEDAFYKYTVRDALEKVQKMKEEYDIQKNDKL